MTFDVKLQINKMSFFIMLAFIQKKSYLRKSGFLNKKKCDFIIPYIKYDL